MVTPPPYHAVMPVYPPPLMYPSALPIIKIITIVYNFAHPWYQHSIQKHLLGTICERSPHLDPHMDA